MNFLNESDKPSTFAVLLPFDRILGKTSPQSVTSLSHVCQSFVKSHSFACFLGASKANSWHYISFCSDNLFTLVFKRPVILLRFSHLEKISDGKRR